MLIKPNSPVQVEIVELDTNGRFIILRLKTPGETPGGGGLPYETDGDARRLA